MPYIAKNRDTGDIVITEDADSHANFVCLDCDGTVAYVGEHQRKGVSGTVNAFFRYDECAHAGIDPSESEYTGSATGGAGESNMHKQRKWTALQVAIEQFDHSYYATEKRIGSKRADAVLEFQEPHEEYGRGFVIEYQHKNESKDIIETERHFAEYEYTVLWLWEDQFKSLDGVPEVDLLDGRVCTPWPYAVPKQAEWSGSNPYSFPMELAGIQDSYTHSVEIPATIYKDWVTQTPRDYWEEQGWESAFRSPDGDYATKHYRTQAVVTNRPTTLTVEATIPHDWYWPTPREYWSDHDWEAAFRLEQTETPLEPFRDNPDVSIRCSLPPEVVETLLYNRLDMSTLPTNTPPDVDRGENTAIPVILPATLTDQLPEPGKYACRDCIWMGNDYQVLDDGSTGGTAACPECESSIRLNI